MINLSLPLFYTTFAMQNCGSRSVGGGKKARNNRSWDGGEAQINHLSVVARVVPRIQALVHDAQMVKSEPPGSMVVQGGKGYNKKPATHSIQLKNARRIKTRLPKMLTFYKVNLGTWSILKWQRLKIQANTGDICHKNRSVNTGDEQHPEGLQVLNTHRIVWLAFQSCLHDHFVQSVSTTVPGSTWL